MRDIERSEIEFVANTLGLTPVADSDAFTAAKLGEAKLVEEISTPGGKIVKITGVKNPGKTVSILARGTNRMMLDEAERSIHDALCCVRSLVKTRFLVAGGGAPEMQLLLRLNEYADTVGGLAGYCLKAYSRAFEIIPYTLAENAGLNPVLLVTELRRRHALGDKTAGINVKKGAITNMFDEKVLSPLLVYTSAIKLATECVRMLLKIDDIIAVNRIW